MDGQGNALSVPLCPSELCWESPKGIPRVTSPDTLHGFSPGHKLYLLAGMSCEK